MPRRISRSKKDSFEHFYLTKVALGDCCGCAERVIDWRDIDHAAEQNKMRSGDSSLQRPTLIRSIVRFINRRCGGQVPVEKGTEPGRT